LRLASGVCRGPVAPQQSVLTQFLYESRVLAEDAAILPISSDG
jgi:hypothetical protein